MKMRKIMALCLVIALTVLPVFANGAKETEREQINMWFWGAAPEYRVALDEALVQPYNASQDKYELVITYDNAVDNNIATALAADAGNVPDIIYGSGPAFVSNYAMAGKLADMTPYAEKYGWEDRILPAIYEAGKVKGNLYSLPGGTVTLGFFYNKAVLDDLRSKDATLPKEAPKTIEELEAFMDAALANGYYASVTGNKGWKPVNENYATIALNYLAGSTNVYNALQNEKAWTDPEFVAAIEKSAEWYQKGYFGGKMQNGKLVIDYPNLNFDESCQLLSANKAAFFFGPSMAFQFCNPYFQGEKSKDLGFSVFPMGDENATQRYVLGTVNSFSIWEGSAHKDEAAKIIDMMMTKDFATVLAKVWPGYWALPLMDFNIPTDGFSELSAEFVKAVQDMYAAVADGEFGLQINTFFPPRTMNALVDIDRVWLKDQSAAEYLKYVDSEFEKDFAEGAMPVIPQPNEN